MAKPTVSLDLLKEHLGVNHSLDDALITRFGAAAVDVCIGELGFAENPGEGDPAEWEALDPVPDWFQVAVGFLTTHYYENRSAVVIGQGISAIELPRAVGHILAQHRETIAI